MTDADQRASEVSPSWRWTNIPLPKSHIVGILVSGVLHLTLLREEHTFEGAFEEEYARYKRLVRRYLWWLRISAAG
jgi:protein-S-isoprenylcysteine O-methyltransferase Ste14